MGRFKTLTGNVEQMLRTELADAYRKIERLESVVFMKKIHVLKTIKLTGETMQYRISPGDRVGYKGFSIRNVSDVAVTLEFEIIR